MTGNDTRLRPDDLVGREFAIGLRGYDRDEVDSFLSLAAEAWRETLAVAPSKNGLPSSATALGLAESDRHALDSEMPPDPFAAPVIDPFGAPDSFGTDDLDGPASPPAEDAEARSAAPVKAPEVDDTSRAETERDRATAYAERVAAELDRASARTELAQAQEDALRVVDAAQRRAEAVLGGAREKARGEAEAVLEDARSRLSPLLEQERSVRARLERIRSEIEALTEVDADSGSASDSAGAAADMVTAAEDDPDTPKATFPVGYGSVSVT